MAQSVIINGTKYGGVPRIKIPISDDPQKMAVFPDTSSATASPADLLDGKTAYANGEEILGEMANNGSFSENIKTADQVVSIPYGFHNGNGTVSIEQESQEALVPGNIKSGVTILGVAGEANVNDTTLPDTGASPDNILAGKQAWVNGKLVTGSMPENGELTETITTPTQTAILKEGHYTGGSVKINEEDQGKIIPENIRGGVTILGMSGDPKVNNTTLGGTAAGAGDLTAGKQAWVNGELLTGTGTQPSISVLDGVLSIR